MTDHVKMTTHPSETAKQALNIGELETTLGYLLRVASRASNRLVEPVMRDHGFTRAELTTLMIIAYNPDCSLLNIARAVGIEPPGTQRLVNALMQKKYIISRKTCLDRRFTLYTVTKAGLNKIDQVKNPCNQQDQSLVAGISNAEIDLLMKLLLKISRHES